MNTEQTNENIFTYTFLLYLVVEILQYVHEISSFPEVLYKRGDLENSWKFIDKYKAQSYASVLSKDVLENLAKFTDKHLCLSLFYSKTLG